MLIKNENELGSINLDRHVIEKIVKFTTKDFPGVICLTNSKGQNRNMMNYISEDMDSYLVEVKKTGLDIHIKLNVILKFGVSINNITNELIQQIKNNIHDVTGVTPKTVSICIKGIKSKKLAKRNIVVKG